jgi:RND family efflux transporter MFP subunit
MKRSNRNLYLTVLIVGCAVLITGCRGEEGDAPEKIRPVRTMQVFATGGARSRAFSGTSQAGLESRLSFKVAGTVQQIGCQLGDAVEAGRLIARLDPTDYQLQVEEAEASLNRQTAQQRNASANYDRTRGLYEGGHTSLTELDAARASYETAKAAVRAAEKGLELARSRLRYTTLRAPIAGSIAQIDVEVNENVRTGQVVVVLTSGSHPEVRVSVPELLIGQIEEGDPVTVAFDAFPDRRFDATVTEVAVAATGAATTFPVTVRLAQPDESIRPGMAAEVAFLFEAADGGELIVVPPVAVGEDRQGRYVFVLEEIADGEGIARRREVRVGELTGEGLVIEEGLADGDILVTAGVTKLRDGRRVRLLGQSGVTR